MSSLIPLPTFTLAGLVTPSETDIKAGVWAVFQKAFGGKLNQSDATPQGQIVTALTAAFGASNDLLAEYVGLVDPATSEGRMQDAIGRLSYIERIAAEPTIVTAQCIGTSGTVIQVGSLAKATDGTLYQAVNTVTIPDSGTVNAQFAATVTGPIECPAGSLNLIYRIVPGWDAITNAAAGVPGRDEETPAEFEARRAASVSINASGIIPAIRAKLLGVTNVVDAYVTDNATDSSATIGGVSVPARSLYASVYGGSDADIAAALFAKKVPGCGFAGSTTVTVQDTASSYAPPYPSYSVSFQRAAELPIYFAVTLADNGSVPSDAESQVQAAIVSAFSGGDGGQKARIGGTTYALRFASAVSNLGSWAQLVSIKVGTTSTPTADDVTATIAQMPTTSAGNIAVALA